MMYSKTTGQSARARSRVRLMAGATSCLLVITLTGCGGGVRSQPAVKATELPRATGTNASAPVTPPPVIYVTDFYLPPGMIEASPSAMDQRQGPASKLRQDLKSVREQDPAEKAKKIVTTLGESITRELNKAGYRAEYRPSATGLRREFFPNTAALPPEGWLLGGWFERLQEGNRVQQATIGFGAGAGQVAIEVVVSDLANNPHQPFLCIGSENAKKNMPGGLVSMNPYAMAAKFVLARGQTERDVKAMGSAIARSLVQYLRDGGAPPTSAKP